MDYGQGNIGIDIGFHQPKLRKTCKFSAEDEFLRRIFDGLMVPPYPNLVEKTSAPVRNQHPKSGI